MSTVISMPPDAWLAFQKSGRNGIKALQAPRLFDIPTKMEQMQCNEMGRVCLDRIRNHYKGFSQGFEMCAINIAKMMDNNFQKFNLTRPWRDGAGMLLAYMLYNLAVL